MIFTQSYKKHKKERTLKRLELFEFEDLHWLPNTIRSGATNLLALLHKLFGTADVLAKIVRDIQDKIDITRITDLGSGSGGPMIDVINQLNKDNSSEPIQLVLTDLFPNQDVVQEINNRKLRHIQYHHLPVDATNISTAPKGLKTMIASFHHMNPVTARKILQSAQDNREPILIYEIAKNTIPVVIWWLLLPISLVILILMVLVMTPFVRPLKWSQLFFTYILPIIPIVYAWDGQASLMRTYTFEDFRSLLRDVNDSNYQWSVEDAKKSNGKKAGYYVVGYPINIVSR